MHEKIAIILTVTLLLITGCSAPEPPAEIIKIVIPEESNLKTYVVEDEEIEGVLGSREKKNLLNTRYYYQDLENKEKQRLIDKRTRNWRRVIDDELIVGYDKEEDELFYKFLSIEELRGS